MNVFLKRHGLAASVLLAATGAWAAPAVTDQPFVGQTWIVGCQKLPLHSAPNGFSRPVAQLNYRDHVRIEQLTQKYDLPDSQQGHSATQNDSDSLMGGGGKEYFAWAGVVAPGGHSGFVPLNCLVNGALINGPYENPEAYTQQTVSLSGSSAPEAAVSSRGFSKKEKGDKVAMRGMSAGNGVQECSAEQIQANAAAPDSAVSARGFSSKEKADKVAGISAAGNGVCIKENYEGLKGVIQAIPFVADPYTADLAFRREGGLGEFK